MTETARGWGEGPSPQYEALGSRFRPIFSRIAEGAVDRELNRTLPVEAIGWLKSSGFTAIRLPESESGGASLPDLFSLLIELSHADSNVTQALRTHFGVVEDILWSRGSAQHDRWRQLAADGAIIGSAWSELGETALGRMATTVRSDGSRLLLNGKKFYTTGSLYADLLEVGASNEADETVAVLVDRTREGVHVIDDWNGFGQLGSASGTTTFTQVVVEPADIVPAGERFSYGQSFFQLVHLATIAGIGRAISDEVAKGVRDRKRTYSHAAAPSAKDDPQVLQVVGKVRSNAYCAGTIVIQVARALQRVVDAHSRGAADDEAQAIAIAELETAQAVTVVTDLILNGATILFDALGASAVVKSPAFDRHWRNARTLASHNPRIYKDRIVGDFAVNRRLPPEQWQVGVRET